MAEALAAALPGDVTLVTLPGASHYSALQTALARIEL
jgi:pimeloyl-ACP methyl ester carboxylesterase